MPKRKRQDEPDLVKLLMGVGGEKQLLSPGEMIENLQERGYTIVKKDPVAERKIEHRAVGIATERWEGGSRLRFAVVSDTQLGSRKQQLTFLNVFYDRVVAEGIDTVLHAGDLFDGDGRVYPGQEFDLFLHGYDRQLDYGAERYPRRDGVTTYVIAGNHDWSFWQRKGADILKELATRRPDITYLGPMSAQIELGSIRVQLIHLKSGLTYARSYKLQKIIEQLPPESKPEMLFAGDRHSWAHVPMYRNCYGWQVGCFQSQTEHEKRLGLYPEIGGLLVEVHYGTKGADRPSGIVSVKHEIVPFFKPSIRDYP